MPDTNPQVTLDTNASEFRLNRFEAAWRAGGTAPDWRLHLPADEELCGPDYISELLLMDIEYRIKASLPALLGERYFDHPRLQKMDARLTDAKQVELIYWEYQQRLQNGERPRRAEYEVAFPRHIEALREMKARSRCPRCQKILDLEETFQTLLCPNCDSESVLLVPNPPSRAAAAPPPEFDLRTYQLIEELGRGGMGAVYRADDPALGRDLAIKVMKSDYRGHAVVESRFLREARVTGSLQHPGIVPVYNLGRLADGRLHYTMRLVRGQTLAEILKNEGGKPECLPNLLGIFEKICQAVAYAHSRRVIHRDLKPANVMVGKFGEVQVMDWGLAKKLTPDDANTESEESTDAAGTHIFTESAATPVDLSRMGSGMGTLAYMPPEQALGEWDTVDERADVFALGSILCEILTGQPAYSGTDGNEIYRRAKRGDVAEALERLEKSESDAALLALCRECLNPKPEDRPRDADAVSKRVAEHQAEVQERLRQTELERVAAESRAKAEMDRAREALARVKAERRAKRRTLALAAAVILLFIGGGGVFWWQQEEAARNQRGVMGALAEMERLQRHGRWVEARIVLDQAEDRLGEARAQNLRDRLRQERQNLELVARLDRIRLKASTIIENQFDLAGADRDYAEAFHDAGFGEVGEDTSTVASQIRKSGVSAVLIAALDHWATCMGGTRRNWVLEVARKSDPDPKRDLLRDPKMYRDGAALQLLVEDQWTELSPQLLVSIGRRLNFLGKEGTHLLRKAQDRYPDDFWIYSELGNALVKEKPNEAVGFYQAALALRPGMVAIYVNLGAALSGAGRGDDAIAMYRQAIELDPKSVNAHSNLGSALSAKGLLDEAISECRKAIDLNPKSVSPRTNLGVALSEVGRLDEAVAELERAIDLDPNLAEPHANLGNVLKAKGLLDKAIVECRRAIEIKPRNAKLRVNLGGCLLETGRVDEAITEYYKAIELDCKDPDTYVNLSAALFRKGHLDKAIVAGYKAIALNPNNAKAHCNLGVALSTKGFLNEGIAECRLATKLAPKDATSHICLGAAIYRKGNIDEAIAEIQEAIKLDPKDAMAHYNLGEALYRKGRLGEAISEYYKAIKLDPKYASPHKSLTVILFQRGHLEEAISEGYKAIELDPRDAEAHAKLAPLLGIKGQLDKAIAECHKAIELGFHDADVHSNLAAALIGQGRLDEGIAEGYKAVQRDPKRASAHSSLGASLIAAGRLEEAIAEYRTAIQLDSKLANAYALLGRALSLQGRFTAGKQSLQRCLELFPPNHPQRRNAILMLRQNEYMIELEKKVTAIVIHHEKIANMSEQLAVAQLCRLKRWYVSAARLSADAFTVEPKLAANPNEQHRYNAACAAALAAAGQGEDARLLPDKVTVMFRRWALDWLRDDLTAYGKLASQNNPKTKQFIQHQMAHWRRDGDLASVRDPQAMERLPDSERAAWQALWRDVDELAKRVTNKDAMKK